MNDRVVDLEREKEEWRKMSATQANKIKQLEEELSKAKASLDSEEDDIKSLRKDRADLAVKLGQTKMDRCNAVRELLPAVLSRLLGSHEYKRSFSIPFSLSLMDGWLWGVSLERTEEELGNILKDIDDLDLKANELYQALYDKIFSAENPYVDKIRKACYLPLSDIIKIFPAPALAKPMGTLADFSAAVNTEGP